jgi:hypothetical protein
MSPPQPFQMGDRVRLVRHANGLAKGLSGTVVRVLTTTDCCDVQFERYPFPRLVYSGDLELLDRAQAVGQL